MDMAIAMIMIAGIGFYAGYKIGWVEGAVKVTRDWIADDKKKLAESNNVINPTAPQ